MNMGGDTGFSAAQNDLKSASFFDGGREGVLAFAAVGVLGIILAGQFAPDGAHPVVLTLGILAVAIASMVVVARFFARRQAKAQEAEANAYRDMIESDRQQKIAKMKNGILPEQKP